MDDLPVKALIIAGGIALGLVLVAGITAFVTGNLGAVLGG